MLHTTKTPETYDELTPLFYSIDILPLIASFLPYESFINLKEASSFCLVSAEFAIKSKFNEIGLTEAEMNTFNACPNFIKQVIVKSLLENDKGAQIKTLLQVLPMDQLARGQLLEANGFHYDKISKSWRTATTNPFTIPNVREINQPFSAPHHYTLYSNPSLRFVSFGCAPGSHYPRPYEISENANLLPHENGGLTSDSGLSLVILELLSKDQISRYQSFICNKYAVLLFGLNLIELQDIIKLPVTDPTYYNIILNEIFCMNGFIALKEKLIPREELKHFTDLKDLLTDRGIIALREKLITFEQAKKLNTFQAPLMFFANLKVLLTNNGLEALREKLITPEQIGYIPPDHLSCQPYINYILSDEAIKLKKAGLISLDGFPGAQIANALPIIKAIPLTRNREMITYLIKNKLSLEKLLIFGDNIPYLFSENGLYALRKNLFTLKQAETISDLQNLLSENGLIALEKGLITISEAQQYSHFGVFNFPNIIKVLEEKLLSWPEIIKLSRPHLIKIIMSDGALQALRHKWISAQEIITYYEHSYNNSILSTLLNKTGLIALRKNLITFQKATEIINLSALLDENNPDIIKALQFKLIKLSDFECGGRYTYSYNDSPSYLTKLTNDLLDSYESKRTIDHELDQKAIFIQHIWRKKLVNKQFGLFNRLENCMKEANLDSIETLSRIKNKIEAKKLTEATLDTEQLEESLGLRR